MRLEARVTSWPMWKFLVTNLERSDDGAAWSWAINLPVLTAALLTMEGNPLRSDDRYAGPTLFIAGGKSDYIGAGDDQVIGSTSRRRDRGDSQSGHNPHMETREKFVALVREA